MKLSLYQIEQEYLSIAQQLIDNGGEANEELIDRLAINEHNLETKSTNYGFVIRQLEGECEIIDNEIKRLQALRKSRENAVDRLKNNISVAMQIFGVEEIKTPILKINFRKSESVEVEDAKLLDRKFIVVKTSESVDKVKIKEAIKTGVSISGAVLKTNYNLQIK